LKFRNERLRKFLRLSLADRVLLCQAWGLFLLAELALRILPLKSLLAVGQKLSLKTRQEPGAARPARVPHLAWLVEVAGRYAPVKATCLKQALVLSWLLGRRGIATTLRIGVARGGGSFEAHAWLEQDGQVLLGLPASEGYEPLLPAG
jgi:hypothetical protein